MTAPSLGPDLDDAFSTLSDAIGRIGRRARARRDRVEAYGASLGLPEDEVAETIRVWLTWYAQGQGDHRMSWDRVCTALNARAGGEPWRPA